MLTLLAPAKLNLTLEVLSRRPDGFHEIRSVMQTINLCDTLHFRLSPSIEFSSDSADWSPEKSLVSRAARLVQQTAGGTKGATVKVDKRIPLVSGLGGDSSDAAAVLHGLNKLWGLDWPQEKLVDLAVRLGSDVAFFLYGGTALVAGRGEMVTPLPALPRMWVVLLLPPVPRLPGKTQRLYDSLRASHYSAGQATERLVARLTSGGKVISSSLYNVFDEVALDSFTGLAEYRKRFWRAEATSLQLAGSGPALFSLVENKAQAEKIYENLKEQGLESYLVETLTAK